MEMMMFGIFKRVREIEKENEAMRRAMISTYAQLESLHLLTNEIFDNLAPKSCKEILARLKQFVERDIGERIEWLSIEEHQLYKDQANLIPPNAY